MSEQPPQVSPQVPSQQPQATPPRVAPVIQASSRAFTPQEIKQQQMDYAYQTAMKAKKQRANRIAFGMAGVAGIFFLFPLVFTVWKTNQGADSMMKNKTMSGPGQKSIPISDYERENGQFSVHTQDLMASQFASLQRQQQEMFMKHPSGISPQQQYEMYMRSKTQEPLSAQQQFEVYKQQKKDATQQQQNQ